MGTKKSKNNDKTKKVKIVTSFECENCQEQCAKGLAYLEKIKIKQQGTGTPCFK